MFEQVVGFLEGNISRMSVFRESLGPKINGH